MEKKSKKKKKLREQYVIFSPACCNTDDKIINNTSIIRDSVSTIPKYHYVNNDPDQMPRNAESLFIFSTGSLLQTYIKQNKTDNP